MKKVLVLAALAIVVAGHANATDLRDKGRERTEKENVARRDEVLSKRSPEVARVADDVVKLNLDSKLSPMNKGRLVVELAKPENAHLLAQVREYTALAKTHKDQIDQIQDAVEGISYLASAKNKDATRDLQYAFGQDWEQSTQAYSILITEVVPASMTKNTYSAKEKATIKAAVKAANNILRGRGSLKVAMEEAGKVVEADKIKAAGNDKGKVAKILADFIERLKQACAKAKA